MRYELPPGGVDSFERSAKVPRFSKGQTRSTGGSNDVAFAESFPHARVLFACVLAALVVAFVSQPDEAEASAKLDGVERKIVRKVNRIRASHGLPRVKSNRALARSADAHCRDMLRADFFAHTSSNGRSFDQRIRSYRRSKRMGETLAYMPGRRPRGQARRVVSMWMNSPGHRAALLSSGFRRIGVARAKGRLNGRRSIVFTADLASKK